VDADGETAAIEKAKEILTSGVKAFIHTSVRTRVVDEDDTASARCVRLVASLKKMSAKFHFFAFAQMAHMASADPFTKIKGMISEMIEKLLNKANAVPGGRGDRHPGSEQRPVDELHPGDRPRRVCAFQRQPAFPKAV
jgi:hypothetical protein